MKKKKINLNLMKMKKIDLLIELMNLAKKEINKEKHSKMKSRTLSMKN